MSNLLKRHIAAVLAALTLVLAFTACRTQQAAPAVAAGPDGADPFAALTASYSPGWKALRVPFTLRLTEPKEMAVGGTATMLRDSSVLLSFRMLGFEVAALQLSGDSLTIVEKMNKQYLTLPVARALGGFDASVANIQDLLTGRVFILGRDSVTAAMERDFTLSVADDGRAWALTPRRQPRGTSYAFALIPSGALAALTVVPDGYPEATVTFAQPVTTPCGAMAPVLDIDASAADKAVKASIEWDWRKARFDDDADIRRLTIGRGYKALDINALLKKLPSTSSK